MCLEAQIRHTPPDHGVDVSGKSGYSRAKFRNGLLMQMLRKVIENAIPDSRVALLISLHPSLLIMQRIPSLILFGGKPKSGQLTLELQQASSKAFRFVVK